MFDRAVDPVALYTFTDALHRGVATPSWLIQDLVQAEESQDRNAAILRLYRACFNRPADGSGYFYWLAKLRGGLSLGSIAVRMTTSQEFSRRYGSLSNAAFVDAVYRNVLGHAADPEGRSFWTDRLDRNLTSRSGMMVQFSESRENRTQLSCLSTSPSSTPPCCNACRRGDHRHWHYRTASPGASLTDMIDTLRTGGEYRARFT
ncbi:MAG: DUF4214 domain-containing protein [Acidimicrobiales bacterium]